VTQPSSAPTSTGRSLLLFVGTVVLTLVLDQLSKAWALTSLEPTAAPRHLIGTLVQLRLTLNSGAALSIGTSSTWVFTIVAAVVVVVVARLARRIRSRAWAVALGMLLGGAVGNLADRLFRAPGFPSGHVVDFIDYGVFIGNVADIAIVLAAVAIVLLTFLGVHLDGSRGEPVADVAPTAGPAPAHEPDPAAGSAHEPDPAAGPVRGAAADVAAEATSDAPIGSAPVDATSPATPDPTPGATPDPTPGTKPST